MLTLSDFSITRKEAILSNGLKLVVFERPNTLVAIRVLTFAGHRFDPADKQGLAHFVEHTLINGTKKFPTKDKMAAYIEEYGVIITRIQESIYWVLAQASVIRQTHTFYWMFCTKFCSSRCLTKKQLK